MVKISILLFLKKKTLVLQLDHKTATAIKERQEKFQKAHDKADLQTIHNNYLA